LRWHAIKSILTFAAPTRITTFTGVSPIPEIIPEGFGLTKAARTIPGTAVLMSGVSYCRQVEALAASLTGSSARAQSKNCACCLLLQSSFNTFLFLLNQEGEQDVKFAAYARFTFSPDLTPVSFYHLLDDSQSQPGSSFLSRPGPSRPIKPFKNIRQVL